MFVHRHVISTASRNSFRSGTHHWPSVQPRAYRDAGPKTATPNYDALDRVPLNRAVMALFRRKMVSEIGQDSMSEGYGAIIDLTRKLNAKFVSPRETQVATRRILQSLFPTWLPALFKIMFAKPLPGLSYKMNALVTSLTCQWLMGPNVVNDVEVDGGSIGKGQGVLIERYGFSRPYVSLTCLFFTTYLRMYNARD